LRDDNINMCLSSTDQPVICGVYEMTTPSRASSLMELVDLKHNKLTHITELVRVAVMILTRVRGCLVRISAGISAIVTDVFHGFLPSLQTNSGILSRLDDDSFIPNLF
jgi:hypothetical protein